MYFFSSSWDEHGLGLRLDNDVIFASENCITYFCAHFSSLEFVTAFSGFFSEYLKEIWPFGQSDEILPAV